MKIAVVSASFLPAVGGAEFVVHHLATHWCRQGHDVRVINSVTDQVTQPGAAYDVVRFKQLRGTTRFGAHRFPFSWYAVRNLQRALDEYKPDYISAHMGYPAALWLSCMRPVPRFHVTCHGGELTKFYWGIRAKWNVDPVLKRSLNSASGVIAISSYARYLMEELGVEPSRILDIPNGLEIERFSKPITEFNLREKLQLPPDSLVILSVGREHPQKAYDRGIRAFARVADEVPKGRYVIVGRNVDRWSGLAWELGVGDRVAFCSGLFGDELVGAYQQADLFFSPSIWEMMPLVVLEAMAAGRPAVVTNVSGSQDLVETGHNGILVEPDQIDQMGEALLSLLKDEQQRVRLGEVNRSRAAEYAWERISRMYLEHA